MKLNKRLMVTGTLRFDTAFHLGSGDEGEGATDMGVLLDYKGEPCLPGSSLKGAFRSAAESLAEHLGMSTCFLEKSHSWCAGGNEKLSKERLKELEKAQSRDVNQILDEALCDTCKLFGSSLARGFVRFRDAQLLSWAEVLEKRDGVGIDRDSGTAVDRVKYNFLVVPQGASFEFHLEAENLNAAQEGLILAVVLQWQRGVSLGGMTSRGLGHAILESVEVREVDLTDSTQRLAYLLDGATQTLDPQQLMDRVRTACEEVSHA